MNSSLVKQSPRITKMIGTKISKRDDINERLIEIIFLTDCETTWLQMIEQIPRSCLYLSMVLLKIYVNSNDFPSLLSNF